MKLSVLVADDEERTRRIVDLNLRQSYDLFPAENGAAALRILREQHIDIVLTDLRMPDIDGAAILQEVRKSEHPIPVIIVTAFGSIDRAIEAMGGMGAFVGKGQRVLVKPNVGWDRTAEQFDRDSRDCVREAKSKTIGGPVSGLAVDVIEPMYRYCLTTRGYARVKQYEPPAPGAYRGLEDEEEFVAAVGPKS